MAFGHVWPCAHVCTRILALSAYGAGHMRLSGVRPSVCLSVRPFHHSSAARRYGGFAAVGRGPASKRYRSIAARPVAGGNQQSRRSAARSSKRGQRHADRYDLHRTNLCLVTRRSAGSGSCSCIAYRELCTVQYFCNSCSTLLYH